MATGDIHNHNGTICKAEKGRCPFGEDGHSKDIDSYVAHHVEESGVDGDAVRSMISDGTPPADAVEVAKLGLSATGSPLSREYETYEDEINAETYGFIRNLKGDELKEAIREAEGNLSAEYLDGLDETLAEGWSVAELNAVYKNRLAAIHGVAKNQVTETPDGYAVVVNGESIFYTKSFERYSDEDNYEAQINAETYGEIQNLRGEERQSAIGEAEDNIAAEYQDGLDETLAEGDSVDRLNAVYRDRLAAIHGVSKDRVVTNSRGEIEVDRTDGGVTIYSNSFNKKASLDGYYETDESNRSIPQ